MRKVSETLGSEATVVGTSEIRVPHHALPVGYEVIAYGTPTGPIAVPSEVPGVTRAKVLVKAGLSVEETPSLPDGWNSVDCVDEIMTQLCDVVNELQGLKKANQQWKRTKEILQEARREIQEVTFQWESLQTMAYEEVAFAEPLWNRNERVVAALIGPSGVGKTTATLRIAEKALQAGIPVGLIQWVRNDTLETSVDTLTLTQEDIPLRRAHTQQELMRAIFELSDVELVLIDTDSHSPWLEHEVKLLSSFLEGPGIECHLVLPATWDIGELRDAVEVYGGKIDHVLTTRIDNEEAALRIDRFANTPGISIAHAMNQEGIDLLEAFLPSKTDPTRQDSSQVGKDCLPQNQGAKETPYFQ